MSKEDADGIASSTWRRGESAERVSALDQFKRDLSDHGVRRWGKITDETVARAQASVTDTMHAQKERVLERAQRLISDALEGKRYSGQGEFVAEMRRTLGFPPDGGRFGDHTHVSNLAGDNRLRMIYDMQMTRAHAEIKQAEDRESGLDALFPAQELVRGAAVKEPRDWPARWAAAGGQFYEGRMVALKGDDIWRRISAFDEPTPPFDYNSQMVLEDVDVKEAVDLGLLPESALEDALARDWEKSDGAEHDAELRDELETETPREEEKAAETRTAASVEQILDTRTAEEIALEAANTEWLRKNLPGDLADRAVLNGFHKLETKEVQLLGTRLGMEALRRDDLMVVKTNAVKLYKRQWGGGEYTIEKIRKREKVLAFKPCEIAKRPYWAADEKTGLSLVNKTGQEGFRQNCYDCTLAHELWLRGYNVEALSTLELDTESMKLWKTAAQHTDWNGITSARCIYLGMKDATMGTIEEAGSAEKFKNFCKQKKLKPGRYRLGIQWQTGGAHSTCFEIRKDRSILFFDPQNPALPSTRNGDGAFLKNMLRVGVFSRPLEVYRVDNVPMSLRFMSKLVKLRD